MYLLRFLVFLFIIYIVECRNNVKALTDSLGQEVIEIGTPIKELQGLPPGVEEEPSAEIEEARPTPLRRDTKKKDDTGSQEEEARIEKELAEIYKDTDYKGDLDTNKVTMKKKVTNGTEEKPIARSKNNFKFQPELNNRKDIERFRTSVDEISCDSRVTQKLAAEAMNSENKNHIIMSFIEMVTVMLCLHVFH